MRSVFTITNAASLTLIFIATEAIADPPNPLIGKWTNKTPGCEAAIIEFTPKSMIMQRPKLGSAATPVQYDVASTGVVVTMPGQTMVFHVANGRLTGDPHTGPCDELERMK